MRHIRNGPVAELPHPINDDGSPRIETYPTSPSSTYWAIAAASLGRSNRSGDKYHRIKPLVMVISPLHFTYENILQYTMPNPMYSSSTQGQKILVVCECTLSYSEVNVTHTGLVDL
jgi:hypothetical protein